MPLHLETLETEVPPNEESAWCDVTQFFAQVSSEDTETGEMIHGDAFDLYDIMSAMEIGDPKMDVSAAPGSKRVKSVEERLEENNGEGRGEQEEEADRVLRMLCTEEHVKDRALLVHLMERMLCAETTWFSGQTLPQTILTCLPLHRLECDNGETSVRDPVLRWYLVAVLKCVDVIKEGTNSVDVRDDEELFATPFGFSLAEHHDSEAVVDELDRLEGQLMKEREGQDEATALVTNALLSHVRFRKVCVYLCLVPFEREREREGREIINRRAMFSHLCTQLCSFSSPCFCNFRSVRWAGSRSIYNSCKWRLNRSPSAPLMTTRSRVTILSDLTSNTPAE